MNNEELMKEILTTLDFNAPTLEATFNVTEKRSDELQLLTNDIKKTIFKEDNFRPNDVIKTCLNQAKSPAEMLYIAMDLGAKVTIATLTRR